MRVVCASSVVGQGVVLGGTVVCWFAPVVWGVGSGQETGSRLRGCLSSVVQGRTTTLMGHFRSSFFRVVCGVEK